MTLGRVQSTARVLGCAALLTLGACDIGDTIFLGSGAAGGIGGMASDMSVPPDDAATHDASETDVDPGTDAGPGPSCTADPAVSPLVTTCTHTPSPEPLGLTVLFKWPVLPLPSMQVPSTFTIPLVANMTDDNGDGRIDTCDTPDVLVQTGDSGRVAALHLLSGDTGALHYTLPAVVANHVTPALVDLDRDGEIEIVTLSPEANVLVLDRRGQERLRGDRSSLWASDTAACTAIAVADLDGDDDPEIIAGYDVFDSQGRLEVSFSQTILDLGKVATECVAPVVSDIQGDAELEVTFASVTVQVSTGEVLAAHGPGSSATVAETNGSGLPELVSSDGSSLVIVHEGAIDSTRISGDCLSPTPPTALDIDRDGNFELAFAACSLQLLAIINDTALQVWEKPAAGGGGPHTAFDLSGDGTAELIRLAIEGLSVHDATTGDVLASLPDVHTYAGAFGGPIVADIDDDGSADVLVFSATPGFTGGMQLTVLSSPTRSFPAARRFYNQYAYQPTHFDERGMTIARPASFPVSHQNPVIDARKRLCLP